MKISIITVSYNSAATIEDTLKSVCGQTYSPREHIVVDGGSTDGTKAILESWSDRIGPWVSEKDKGLYDAMNKGLAMAGGDIIGILNADDVYQDNEVLAAVADEFNRSNADAVYGDLVYVDQHDLSKVTRYWRAGKYHQGKFLWGWMPPHPTFFVRRSVYQRLGGFNTQLRSAADYEIMLRFLYKERISSAYLPRVITRMRGGGMSNASLKNRIRANREDRKAWKLNGIRPYPWTLLMKPLSKLPQYFLRP